MRTLLVGTMPTLEGYRLFKFIIPSGYENERVIPGTEVDLFGNPCPPVKASGCLAAAIAPSAEEAMRMIVLHGKARGKGRMVRWVEVADVTDEPIQPGVVAVSY